eukprot:16380225-Heterocapsa_arctica.AAC.1
MAQRNFVQACLSELDARRAAREDDATPLEAMCVRWQPHFLTGGPGSGKTFCTQALVDEAVASGYRVV